MDKTITIGRVQARPHIGILACLTLALTTLVAHADVDPVAAFMKARAQSLDKMLSTAALLPSAMSDPQKYYGRVVELSATVSGLVASGTEKTVLLQSGQQSLTVAVPDSLKDAVWIGVDQPVRVLFVVDPSSNDSLRMIGAAPEYEAAAAERQDAEDRARNVQTSRSTEYARSSDQYQETASTVVGDDGGHPSPALPPRARAVFGAYHHAIHKFNKHLSAEDVDTITNSILYFSDQNDVDPRLICAMIIAESDFHINERSHAGAMGLGQIMPDEARSHGVTDPYDPEQNIGTAVQILRGHLDNYGGAPADAGVIPYSQIRLVMAAYNAGPGAVKKYHGVPPYRETQRYVERVATLYREMCGQ